MRRRQVSKKKKKQGLIGFYFGIGKEVVEELATSAVDEDIINVLLRKAAHY